MYSFKDQVYFFFILLSTGTTVEIKKALRKLSLPVNRDAVHDALRELAHEGKIRRIDTVRELDCEPDIHGNLIKRNFGKFQLVR